MNKTTSTVGRRLAPAAVFLASVLLVLLLLLVLISYRRDAEAVVGGFAQWLPFGYAFAAGMVASVNPCGFFMLPSYISYNLGAEEAGFYDSSALVRLLKAMGLGATATLAFVVIFASVGVIVAAGGYWLGKGFPHAGLAMGIGMLALGLWLLITKRTFGLLAASRVQVTPRKNLRNVFLFGIAYAVGSLSCTLPIFLVVVGSALAARGFAASLGQFIGYALGMGLVLMAVTVGAALFRGTVARWLREFIPSVHRMSALFLLGAGAYLVYYWGFYSGFFF